MKKFYTLFLLSLISFTGWGQLLMHDAFDYPADATNGLSAQSGGLWLVLNSGDSILVEAGSLSYPGLAASTGNKISFAGTGADYYRAFASQTAGTVYSSFILNVTDVSSLNTTGGYFVAFIAESSTTLYGAAIWARQGTTAGSFNIGISPRTSATTIVWLPGDLTTNTNYFLVTSYELVSGAGNDVAQLWLNPSLGGTMPAADATVTNTGGADLSSVEKFLFRQATNTTTPGVQIDEVRVGNTWADVTPAGVAISDPTTTSISPSSATAGGAGFNLTVNGTNFVDGQSTVTWNGTPRTTTFVSATELTAVIDAADIAAPGTADVGVTTTGAANPSNTQTFTINTPATPLISATTLAAFGDVCINQNSLPASFTITGSNLTAADITVAALSGYSYSLTSGGTYTSTLTIPQTGGSFSEEVFVIFNPTAVQSYDGDIVVSGGGASSINVAASGAGINTEPVVTAGMATGITNNGATIPGNITTEGCGTITAYGVEYSTTAGFANGSGTQVAATNLSAGSFSADLTGLSSNTTYYYKTYVTNAGGTFYSSEASFNTTGSVPTTPVATAATNITTTGFTANWNAVAGATNYFLDVYTMGPSTDTVVGWNTSLNTSASITADEGNTNNVGIQTITTNATGTISHPGGPTGSAGVNAFSVSTTGWDNGTDTKYWMIDMNTTGVTGMTLSSKQGSSNTGPANFKIQYRVGGSGTWTDVPGGIVTITTPPSVGNPATFYGPENLPLPSDADNQPLVSIRWIMTSDVSVNNGVVASGGASRISAIYVKTAGTGTVPVYVTGYQNLDVANVTSYDVTGLTPNTDYYYVVRAANLAGSSPSSNEISVTTLSGAAPSLVATTVNSFGNIVVGQASTSQSFTITGADLTGAPGDITVTAPSADFEVSADDVNWGPTAAIPYTSSSLAATTVYVRFTPQATGLRSGDVTISGGGANTTVAVSGTGDTPAIPVAPVATAATNITTTGFTANWNAVAGATNYFLDVYTMGASMDTVVGWNFTDNISASLTADEGNANNIGIQTITHNGLNVISYPGGPSGTGGINAYTVSGNGWDNGADTKYWIIDMNTTGVTGMTLSSLQGSSNTGPANFKIQYRVGASGTWTDVPGGVVTITSPPSPGNPATFFGPSDLALPAAVDNQPLVSIRWLSTSNTSVNGSTVAPTGTSRISAIYVKTAGSGMAPVYVAGYQNLDVGNVTSFDVTGLMPSTDYYYVVRAANVAGSSANSNEIAVTTIAGALPSLTTTTVNDFGNIIVGQTSASQSFTISGADLNGAPGNITITAPSADFEVSADDVNWGSTATIPFTSPTLAATTVYVRFTPQSVGVKSGDLTISGGGANATVAVSGTGALPAPPVAPVATAATNITTTGFTANWNPVAGAISYVLDVYTMGSGSGTSMVVGWNTSDNTAASQIADEGNALNVGIQSITPVGLNVISYPGGPSGTGGINAYSVSGNGWDNGADTKHWMIAMNTTGVTGLTLSSLQGSSNTGPANFKIQYRVGATGAWTDVTGGDVNITVAPSPGNPATFFGPTDLPLPAAVDNQTEVYIRWLMTSNTSVNGSTVASGGTSRISAIYIKGNQTGSVPVFVPGYQNLNVGNVLSYDVTGLQDNTTYYYVVRAINDGGASPNSNEITVTTAPDLNPNLSATALAAFGDVCINTTEEQSFTLTGNNLTTDDIAIGALAGFSYSTTASGTFTPTLTISQPGGSFSQQVFVRFDPTTVQDYSGNITITGGGIANPVNIAVTAAGVDNAPTVTTGGVTNLNMTTATAAGSISDDGCTAVTGYGIEYSTTQGFTPGTGTQTASTNLAGGNFTSDLTGLTLNTTYYYRAYATNATGTGYGNEQSFTTLLTPPVSLTATTLAAFGDVCANTTSAPESFTLTGANLTTANVVVGPLAGYSFSTTETGTYTPILSITQPGGNFNQQVFVRFSPTAAQSYNGNIPVSGGGSTPFTVAASGTGVVTPPSVITGNASDITTSSVLLEGSIASVGCSPVTTYGIEYSGIPGFTPGSGTQVNATNLAGGLFSVNVAGLVPGTTYYYRAYANNAGAISYGDERQFTVGSIPNSFTVYPVPQNRGGQLFFSMNNLRQGNHTISVFNSAGQEVVRRHFNVQGSFINQSITLPHSLAPGVYRVRLNDDKDVIDTRTILVL